MQVPAPDRECASIGRVIAVIPTSQASLTADVRIVALATVAEATAVEMIDRLARADVVFVGEQHDDPETHRAEADLLDAIGRRGRPVVLSLEMFERDVQPVVDDYLAGRRVAPGGRARCHRLAIGVGAGPCTKDRVSGSRACGAAASAASCISPRTAK